MARITRRTEAAGQARRHMKDALALLDLAGEGGSDAAAYLQIAYDSARGRIADAATESLLEALHALDMRIEDGRSDDGPAAVVNRAIAAGKEPGVLRESATGG